MDTTMTTDEMVRQLSNIPEEVGARSCFGEPVERDGHTVIPVARTSFGFGLGFGRGAGSKAEPSTNGHVSDGGEGEGGGGGGGGSATPVAVIDISGERVAVQPIVDSTRIALGSFTMSAWVAFWLFWTIRTIARETSKTRRLAIEKAKA